MRGTSIGRGPRHGAVPASARGRCGGGRFGGSVLRLPAQRGVGDAQHVVAAAGEHLHRSGHALAQLAIGIRRVDHGVVGDHVLDRVGRLADLADRAAEFLAGIGVDGEPGLFPIVHLAHVRLVDVGEDLHLGEVVGDGEQGGRLERRGHGLAHVHRSRNHDAVDRTADPGEGKVGGSLVAVGAGLQDLRLGARQVRGHLLAVRHRAVHVLLRDQPLLDKLLGALLDADGIIELRLGLLHVCGDGNRKRQQSGRASDQEAAAGFQRRHP